MTEVFGAISFKKSKLFAFLRRAILLLILSLQYCFDYYLRVAYQAAHPWALEGSHTLTQFPQPPNTIPLLPFPHIR